MLSCTWGLERTVPVRFSVSGVESGAMTKTLAEDVLVALSASAPTIAPYITLTSTTNPARVYEVRTGQTYTIAVDTYSVSGTGGGSDYAGVYLNGKVYPQSRYVVSDTVTITEGEDSYSLSASYNCFALVFDKTSVSELQVLDGGGKSYLTPSFLGGDENYGVLFFVGNWTPGQPLRVKAVPVDSVNYEERIYTVAYGGGNVNVENGYWYLLSPSAIDVTSGGFGVTLPAWGQGA